MTEHGRLTIGAAAAIAFAMTLQAGTAAQRPAREWVRTRAPITFNRDIAPLLWEHCAPCHRPERAAPFQLLTFEDARRHAAGIADAVTQRRMPPWLPTYGVVKFVGERHLTDEQIALIGQWVEQGTPEGNPANRPAAPQWHSGWQLGTPDLVLEMPESYRVPASGSDVYRNFVMPAGVAERRYVRAFELWPDDPSVVHHAVVTVDRTRWSRHRDAQDPEPGYDGMLAGQAESPDGHFLAWTPGRTATPEPDDMAWGLEPGSDLVVQLHIMPPAEPKTVRVRIGLFFTMRPPTRIPVMLRVGPKSIDMAAGRRRYVAVDEYVLPIDVDVLSVYPHAHYLARSMHAFARLPDGSVRPLLEIPKWNFHWQDEYRYTTPFALPRGTTVSMRFEYANSGDGGASPPHRVVYGPRSSDEMSDLWLQVLPRTPADRATLQAELARRETLADIAGFETLLRARPDDGPTRTLLGSLYMRVGRHADAQRELRTALALAPRDWFAHYNLGAELQARGRPQEADAEYRAAIALNPQAAEAYHARGLLMYGAQRFVEAIEQFHEAIGLWPDYADARNSLGSALAKAGRPSDAMTAYRSALQVNPDHVSALNNLAVLLGTAGQVDEAIRLLRHAVEIAPASADSQKNLAVAIAIQTDRGGVRGAAPRAAQGYDRVSSAVVAVVERLLRVSRPLDTAHGDGLGAEDALFVDSAGRFVTEQQVATIRVGDSPVAGHAKLEDTAVRLYGDAAVVNAHRVSMNDGRSATAERITVVLSRQPSWRIIAYQASRGEGTGDPTTPVVAGAIDAGPTAGADDRALGQLPDRITRLFAVGDDAGYRSLLGDDFVRIGSDGSILTKIQSAARFAVNKSKPIAASEVSDVRVRRFGSVGVVTNEETRIGADGKRNPSRFLRVFVKRHGNWQLVHAHQTPIEGDER